MKSKIEKSETILGIRCTLKFIEVCRHRSAKDYPVKDGDSGSKRSAGRFLKMAACDRLRKDGFTEEYIKSLF